MKLVKVEHREKQIIQCIQCYEMKPQVWADLDGPAFKSYYCEECLADEQKKEQRP